MVEDIQIGNWTFYHENGLVFSEGQFDEKGKPIGVWTEYYENGQIKYEAISPQGNCFTLEDDNLQIINYWTAEGLQIIISGNGKLTIYENDNIQHISFWANGLKTEILQEFYRDGRLYKEMMYKNGLKNGLAKIFHENGNLYSEQNYMNGNKIGKYIEWYEDGQIAEEGEYINEGYTIINFWAENGKQTLINGKGIVIRKYGAAGDDVYEQHFDKGKMVDERKIAGVKYGKFTPNR
jgi:antitoxin component YwqK of YwqJK toxin-antitoxin module